MAETPVTLDFLAAQQQRILDEMASMRADIRLIKDDTGMLSAMVMRQDRATKTLVERIDWLTERFGERLRHLEERQEA